MNDDYDRVRLEAILADIRELNQRIRTQRARISETVEALKRPMPDGGADAGPEPVELRSWSKELRNYSDALLVDSRALIEVSERVLQRARFARARAWTRPLPKPPPA